MGKRKIAIEKIEDKQRRNVTFTKRREGLFKKAQTACQKFGGLQIGIVVFSAAGRPFTFSNSSSVSVDAIIDGYISTSSSSSPSSAAAAAAAAVMGNKRSSRSDEDDDVQVIETEKKKRKTTAVVTPCITTVQEEEEEGFDYKYVDSDQTHVQELIYELMGSSGENNNAVIVTEEIMDQSSQEGDTYYTWAPDHVQEIINLEDFEYADHHHDESTMGLLPPPPHPSTSDLCNSTSSSDMNEEEEEDYGYTLEEWEQILSSNSPTSVVDNSTYMHQEVVPADWPTEDYLHLLCS